MTNIQTVDKLYSNYGVMYPYACDAIAFYIFGNRDDDNIVMRAIKGVYKGSQIDTHNLSIFMLDREYCWQDHIEDIDNFVSNYRTESGAKILNYF